MASVDVGVGLLGYGTVGSAVSRMLAESGDEIERATGHRLTVVRALVRDPAKEREFGAGDDVLTKDFAALRDDPRVDVVAEVMGGLEPAGDYVRELLRAGKPVVSANKQLVAREGADLFAVASDGQVKRIDQHPMANHPVTPMREPDLRRHLAAQTRTPIGLISTHTAAELNHQLEAGTQAILFDGADEQTLTTTGELLWHHVQQSPLFAIGSSGLTAALIPSWRTHENKSCHSDLDPELVEGEGEDPPHFARSGDDAPWTDRLDGAEDNPIQLSLSREKAQPLLVLSGSCSPVTAGQIQWALANGFHGIALDPSKLLNSAAEQARIQAAATASLAAGRSTILYTALGPPSKAVHGDDLGEALGNLLRNLLQTTPTRRILLCGGDTSSHAVQQLGLYALTWTAPIQAGAPLCRAHSDDPMLDSIELILKGGQVGTPNFFHAAQQA